MNFVKSNFLYNLSISYIFLMKSINIFIINNSQYSLIANNINNFDKSMLFTFANIKDI